MAYRHDIRLSDQWFTNTDQPFTFIVYAATATDAEIIAGTAARQDITGRAFSWLVKRRRTDLDAAAAITKTTASGITITDALEGELQVFVVDTDTASLNGGTYWHELKSTDPGEERVLCDGSASLRKSLHLSG